MISALQSHLPILPVITLLFVAYTLSICASRRYRLVESLVIGAEVVTLLGALYIARLVLWRDGSPIIYSAGGWPAPWGIELSVGGLAALSLLMIAVVGLFVALYASVNLEQQVGGRKRTAWFFTLYLLLCAALTGLAVTNDLFNVFVFVEVATISSCALVSARGDAKSTRAAFKYLILATLGSGFVLSGIGLIYILTGNLNMTFASLELSHNWTEYPYVLWLAISLFIVGFGVKSALFPLHVWLPDAHSTALTSASAILSGLAVKGYIIGLIKVLYVVVGPSILQSLGISQILQGLGMVAILAGGLFALAQEDLKRRLAYSTVSQIGYIFFGLGLGNVTGCAGALFYMVSHAVIKASLFLSAGSVVDRTGKYRISEMAGIGRQMPITMAIFTINSLALIGLPLLSGFIGKWTLLSGSFEAGSWLGIAVILLGSLLCAAYLLPVIRLAYFEPVQTPGISEIPLLQAVALVVLATVVLFLGVIPGPLLRLASLAAKDLLGS